MDENIKHIVIITYKSGIVVKGIGKKLLESGYSVKMLGDDIKEISSYVHTTSLFILDTQDDVLDDDLKCKKISDICRLICGMNKSIIILGERTYHAEFTAAIPQLKDYVWLNRPIDMDGLMSEVVSATGSGKSKDDKKRILIIDDDASYAKMVREWLKDTYRVDVVTAGMQGISFLLKNKVDVVLLDYEMPVADGPQILGMLRSSQETANIPVVFLTGIADKESITRVMSLKPSGYILKSSTKEELLHKLNGLLSKLV